MVGIWSPVFHFSWDLPKISLTLEERNLGGKSVTGCLGRKGVFTEFSVLLPLESLHSQELQCQYAPFTNFFKPPNSSRPRRPPFFVGG